MPKPSAQRSRKPAQHRKLDPPGPIIPERRVFAGDMKRRRDKAATQTRAPVRPRTCVYVDESFYVEGQGYRASIVVEGEAGHRPTGTWPYHGKPGETRPWFWGPTFQDAQKAADKHNAQFGLTKREAYKIVSSSFRASELSKSSTQPSFTREDAESLLNLLADAEGPVKALLAEHGLPDTSHGHVCAALRTFADGEMDLPQ